jgi:hypothetical protein
MLSGLTCFADPPRSKTDPEPPKEVGLVERAERRLFPLTVKIRALAPSYRFKAAHLTKEDFLVQLDHVELPPERFELDNFCPDIEEARPPEQPESPKHLLFLVDQLGLEGQDNTHAMLQNMIPRMAAAGYQMRILPNAGSEWTSDGNRLLGDVERLFDPSKQLPENENEPLEDTVSALLENNEVDKALAVAREEELATQMTFEGPAMQVARTISEMADLPMPKAVIYFADSGYFSRVSIVEAALRSGVPIYAVKANGIGAYVPNLRLVDDPEAAATIALLSLSEYTGGEFSFGHYRKSASEKILNKVQTDLGCVYVLNVDAAGLERDRSLRTTVKLRPGFKNQLSAESIPSFTIPSDKRQKEEAASIALRSGKWSGVEQANVSLVPVGFRKSRVHALIQFTLDSELGALSIPTTWDVGINYFGASRVSGYGNLRMTFRSPKVVFEKEVSLPIGPYMIVGVAQEVDGHGLARGTEVGAFNPPNKNAVEFLYPLHIMQWGAGTFVSEAGNARKEDWGSLHFAMANSDRPISLVVSVCRGKNVQGHLTIEKSLLLPDTELRFSKTDWPQEQNAPCLVVKDDLSAAGRLPWSNQPYEVTFVVSVNDASGKTVANTSRAIWIIGPTR